MTFLHPTELKKLYPFLAKKALGQNFLVHRPILETIAQRVLQHHPQTILEIGPGPGSLSQFLAPHCKELVLVEKDEQFSKLLEEVVGRLGNVKVILNDFLKTHLSEILPPSSQTIAVGNLPYNASVAILNHLLKSRNLFTHFYLMFQREVADRLTAKPNTKAYGSLSLYVQMLADVKLILPIPPSAFDPRPKIQSAVVEIIPLAKPRFEVDIDFFEEVIQAAFQMRRKTLGNTLLARWSGQWNRKQLEEILLSIGIDPKRRGETLSLEEFAKVSATLDNKRA